MDKNNNIKGHLDTSFDFDKITVSNELIQRTMAAINADEENRKNKKEDQQIQGRKKPRYIRRYFHSLGMTAAAVLLIVAGMHVWNTYLGGHGNLSNSNYADKADDSFVYEGNNEQALPESSLGIADNDQGQLKDNGKVNGSQVQDEENADGAYQDNHKATALAKPFPLNNIEVVMVTIIQEETSKEVKEKEVISQLVKKINEAVALGEEERNGKQEMKEVHETSKEQFQMILLTDDQKQWDLIIGENIQIKEVGGTDYQQYGMNQSTANGKDLVESLKEIIGND